MRYSKYLTMAVLMCVSTLILQQEAKADLTASEIVSSFNNLNSGQGLYFLYTTSSTYEGRIAKASTSADVADVSAYAASTASSAGYFFSFCVESSSTITANLNYYGQLDYNGGVTQTSSGNVLTVGAAYLYQQFAAGTLAGYSYSSGRSTSATAMREALYVLTGQQTIANWSNNTFLSHLLTVNNSQSYWIASYDPGQYYTEIGNFSVFVMQVTSATNGAEAQDFVYVAKASFGDVPEPATFILWLMGSVSALGAGYAKKRRKKIALA